MSAEFIESRQRCFADLWPIAGDYRIEDGHICPVVGGALVRPWAKVGQDDYMPMAHPELPRELAKAATGDDNDVLEFVKRYGLLGYTQSWSFEEGIGIDAMSDDGDHAGQEPAPGDPLAWFVGHARTVKLVLDLLGSLDEGEAAVREQIERLTVHRELEDGSKVEGVAYNAAHRGYPRPWQIDTHPGEPRDVALGIIEHVLNHNLTGVSRFLLVERQEDGRPGFTSLFTPSNLADCTYWHLADAAAGGWVRRCADPKCGAFFVAKSKRVKYCPPPKGNQGVSPCMNRHKVREHYENQKRKTKKKSTRRRRKTKGGK